MTKGKASDIDLIIGKKIKAAYKECGESMESLAEYCGVSYQQIQKYCNGKNRISASRLFQVSKFTGKPLSYFFGENI
jgi:transcriptional regulator with XRE-family HTH domain